MLRVALVDRVRDVQEKFLREAEPVRQRGDDSDHQHAAHDGSDQTLHLGARPLHLQHETDDSTEEHDEAQRIGQTENGVAQTWSEIFH